MKTRQLTATMVQQTADIASRCYSTFDQARVLTKAGRMNRDYMTGKITLKQWENRLIKLEEFARELVEV